jgi:hypothetical protein
MKTVAMAAFLLAAGTSLAAAEPVKMTDDQLDRVVAGQPIVNAGGIQVAALNNVNAQVAVPVQAGVCVLANRCTQTAAAQDVSQIINRRSLRPTP